MKRIAVIIGFSLVCALAMAQTELPMGFSRRLVAENLNPTGMLEAPDGRIFITEKDGRILIVRNDTLVPEAFLSLAVDSYNERGLCGMALDPNFELNNHFYAFYTVPGRNINRISAFEANGDFAIPGSEEVLLETDEMRAGIHNGGAMFFKADGKLYIGTGDGSNSINAENRSSLLGKILRLNVDGSIPMDNPYYEENVGDYRAIYASGLRNPFSMAYDHLNDRLFASDVGGEKYEEINLIEPGGFYGWDRLEGPNLSGQLPANYVDPVYAYSHVEGCAIVGSAIYSPDNYVFPERYSDTYFFADYCKGWIRVLNLGSGDIVETFITGADRIVAMLVSRSGALYYLERRGIGDGSPQDNSGTVNGVLWKIEYTGSGAPFIAREPEDILVSTGESAAFTVEASGADELMYTWFVNGVETAGNGQTLLLTNLTLADSGTLVQCQVSNTLGTQLSNTAILEVTNNRRPVINFIEPTDGALYSAGSELRIDAVVVDPEDGDIVDDQITWWIDFYHRDHTHPALGFQNGPARGSFMIPRVGEIDTVVWYRIYVNARDSKDLEQTVHQDIYPSMASFLVESQPPGLEISVDGAKRKTPFAQGSVQGIQRTLQAPTNQIFDGRIFFFENWNDATDQNIIAFPAGEDQGTYVANYRSRAIGKGIGLTAEYFDNIELQGSPVHEQIDSVVDVNFFFDPPGVGGLGQDMFAVRWSGGLLPYESAEYAFVGTANDGMRLWINDQLIFDEWDVVSAARLMGGSIYLEANRLYDIRVEYYEYNWAASCRLEWSSDFFDQEVIPPTQLYPIVREGDLTATVSPNPATTSTNMHVESSIAGLIDWRLIDATGRELQTFTLEIVPGDQSYPLNIGNLVPGVYFLQPDLGIESEDVIRLVVH